MQSELANLRTLVLPAGAGAGSRIVLDGVNGVIDIYDAGNNLVVAEDSSGIKALGTAASGSFVQLTNAGPQAQVNLGMATQGGHTQTTARLAAFAFTPGGLHPALEIDSPTIDGQPGSMITLVGQDSTAVDPTQIQLTANSIYKNSARARMLVYDEVFPASAILTLAAAANPLLLGASSPSGLTASGAGIVTVATLSTDSRWQAVLETDAQVTTAGDTTVGELKVDGIVQTAQCLYSVTGATGRATISQFYKGNFPVAGNHTFQATGRRVGAGAANVFNSVHSGLGISIFE